MLTCLHRVCSLHFCCCFAFFCLQWGFKLVWTQFPAYFISKLTVYAGVLIVYGAISVLVFENHTIAGHAVSEGAFITFGTLLVTFSSQLDVVCRTRDACTTTRLS